MSDIRLSNAKRQKNIRLRSATYHSVSHKWELEIFASSGTSYYKVQIPRSDALPSCSCPDHRTRGTVCKHLLYLVVRVCRMEMSSSRQLTLQNYQSLYYEAITQKLLSIFQQGDKEEEEKKEERKEEGSPSSPSPAFFGDCVICLTEIEEAKDVYTCSAICKKIIGHVQCVEHWLARMHPTCPLCRGSLGSTRKKRGRGWQQEEEEEEEVKEEQVSTALFYIRDT